MKTTLLLVLFVASSFASRSQNLPYYSGFDNTEQQTGWTFFREGDVSSSDWSMIGGGYSVPNSLHHDYNVGAAKDQEVIDWMVSPPMQFTGPVAISLMVSESGFSTPTDDNCLVYVGTGNQDPEIGNFTLIGNLSFISPQWTWIDTTLYTNITGDECYLAFRYKTIGAAWCTYSIDDVEVQLQDPNLIGESGTATSELLFSPNPANDILFVSGMQKDHISIQFFSVTGQLLKECQLLKGQTFPIDVSDLETGMYFLTWKNERGLIQSEKLMVQ